MARIKRLDATDLLSIPTEGGNHIIATKQEVAKHIKDFISIEIGNLPKEMADKHKKELVVNINEKMVLLEKELIAFIDYRFDSIAEKACEMLLNRKFTEEVNRKVDERIEKIILDKQKKGKF
jgi:hypothetical protein